MGNKQVQAETVALTPAHTVSREEILAWLSARVRPTTAETYRAAILSMLRSGVDLTAPDRVAARMESLSPQHANRLRAGLAILLAVNPSLFADRDAWTPLLSPPRGRPRGEPAIDEKAFGAWLRRERHRNPASLDRIVAEASFAVRRMEKNPDDPFDGLHPSYAHRLKCALGAYHRFLVASGATVRVGDVRHTPIPEGTRRILGLVGSRFRASAHQTTGGLRLPNRTVTLSRLTWDHIHWIVDYAGTPTGFRVASEVTARVWKEDAKGVPTLTRYYDVLGARAVSLLLGHHAWAAPMTPYDPLFPTSSSSRVPLAPEVIADVLAEEQATAAQHAADTNRRARVMDALHVIEDGLDQNAPSKPAPIIDPSLSPEEQDAALLAITSKGRESPFAWLDDPETGSVVRVVPRS